jgi:hypothetical protein
MEDIGRGHGKSKYTHHCISNLSELWLANQEVLLPLFLSHSSSAIMANFSSEELLDLVLSSLVRM